MSKTMDELMAAFKTGFRDRLQGPGIRPEGDIAIRAGIAAVVRAVRDEMDRQRGDDWRWGDTVYFFNKILGDAGNDPAPVYPDAPLVVSATGLGLSPAPAPAVCEWTDVGKGWDTGCGGWDTAWSSSNGNIICSICKAPIKFTEAQR